METHSKFLIFIKTTDFVSIVCIIISYILCCRMFLHIYSIVHLFVSNLGIAVCSIKVSFCTPPPSLVTTSSWWTCAFILCRRRIISSFLSFQSQTLWYFYSTVNHSFIRTVYRIQMLLAKASLFCSCCYHRVSSKHILWTPSYEY